MKGVSVYAETTINVPKILVILTFRSSIKKSPCFIVLIKQQTIHPVDLPCNNSLSSEKVNALGVNPRAFCGEHRNFTVEEFLE